MSSKHPFLKKLKIRGATAHVTTTDLGYIKDALMAQVQPMYGEEIVDVDLGDFPDKMTVTYYTKSRKKGKSG